ncbi:rhodanese-like domain-containing protein [Halostella sp. JP-L12]|uniref:rhodanese-like domain-containing protein n=1 Tax=Halostella TaxID=1843185 RepID=UPI000EF7AF97|nr:MULTISPECIES: rhodanese-like domain-containing protein [Halostella]NHN48188.1 rhodanese-like domain-containing protein [Halostella sp. JP-L12]
MVEEITPAELQERLADGDDVQVVDIRPAAAFEEGHIPGAENVPFPEFTSAVEERDWGDDVVVACPIGQSSVQAGRLLESHENVGPETTVASLAGGYDEWDGDLEEA